MLLFFLLLLLFVSGAPISVSSSSSSSSPPSWPLSQSSALFASTLFPGVGRSSSAALLFWDVEQQAFRCDRTQAGLESSLLVLYATRLAYVFSANSSLCNVFCLPPRAQTLPLLRVAANDTRGRTLRVGPGLWLRQTFMPPDNSGLMNASVLTQVDPDTGAPLTVDANYTTDGQLLAQHFCTFKSFVSPARIDPATFLPPSNCRNQKPYHCYAPLETDPFAVAQGCYFAESLAPFGTPPDDSCSCS